MATVIALAFDPFVQQLVQYQTNVKYSPDSSTTIARAQRYGKGNEVTVQDAPVDFLSTLSLLLCCCLILTDE